MAEFDQAGRRVCSQSHNHRKIGRMATSGQDSTGGPAAFLQAALALCFQWDKIRNSVKIVKGQAKDDKEGALTQSWPRNSVAERRESRREQGTRLGH